MRASEAISHAAPHSVSGDLLSATHVGSYVLLATKGCDTASLSLMQSRRDSPSDVQHGVFALTQTDLRVLGASVLDAYEIIAEAPVPEFLGYERGPSAFARVERATELALQWGGIVCVFAGGIAAGVLACSQLWH